MENLLIVFILWAWRHDIGEWTIKIIRESNKRAMTDEDFKVGAWLSAAMEDPSVCDEMKKDVDNWFKSFEVKNES